jgi:hypothetical protein
MTLRAEPDRVDVSAGLACGVAGCGHLVRGPPPRQWRRLFAPGRAVGAACYAAPPATAFRATVLSQPYLCFSECFEEDLGCAELCGQAVVLQHPADPDAGGRVNHTVQADRGRGSQIVEEETVSIPMESLQFSVRLHMTH